MAKQKPMSLEDLCINTVRTLSMDAVQKADSGHPGTPMALAPLCYLLWTRHLRHNPTDPAWPGRDRFVLSCGHASMLLYSLLYLTGYDLSLDEIKNFRQWGSKTPGHPEHGLTPGVETTTGPLGQGVGNAVGMALAETHLAAVFNRPGFKLVDHYTYFLASDGDMMEGVSHEAGSLAGHLQLGKIIGFYDDNRITIEGETSLAYSDNAAKRFEGYGWHTQRVADGNDLKAIEKAIQAAKKVTDKPSLIVVRTHIGFGSPNKHDSAEAHGSPLGVEEIKLTKQNLGWPTLESFFVPEKALAQWRKCQDKGAQVQAKWQKLWDGYKAKFPAEAKEWERRMRGELPAGWEASLPTFDAKTGTLATRDASHKVLNAIGPKIPELVGGSADLAPSTKTLMKDLGDYGAENRKGRNLHFGIREHGMGSVMNGMALHQGIIPFGATFLIFNDYMRPPIRLASLMEQHAIYVFTHDSIGLGEDGPTHQPIEALSALRAIPGLVVLRPADSTETVEAWRIALTHKHGPVAMALTRQKTPFLDRTKFAPASGVLKGAYVLRDSEGPPQVVLMSTGSEVGIVVAAQEKLQSMNIRARVVSCPSLELFAAQTQAYRDEVLPPSVPKRLAVEAAHPMSWYRWVGSQGEVLGIERFGASAPYERIYKEFGLTPENVVTRVQALLARSS
ncbi:MAG TPA: transketolase [Gemmatimonadales bacterium]|jgi:transketolase